MKRLFHRRLRPPGWVVLIGCALLGLLASLMAADDGSLFGNVKDFRVPEYYPSPNQNQMKSLLTGSNAVLQSSTIARVNGLRLETFRLDGSKELTVEADSCVFDTKARTASSEQPIKVEAMDGRVQITGEGFVWQAAESTIIISNHVHTVIKRGRASEHSSSR